MNRFSSYLLLLVCGLSLSVGDVAAHTSLTEVPSVIPEVQLTPTPSYDEYLMPVAVDTPTTVPETVFSALLGIVGFMLMLRRRSA